MGVIADTSVWISYFRDRNSREGDAVERLIRNGDLVMVGVIYVELMRGARGEEEYRVLSERLDGLTFLESTRQAWRQAGRLLFDLRRQGQTIPLTDALIAAQALSSGHSVYTLDEHFARVPGLRLHEVGSE